jgi:LmbE family N-acetylglucosaminyl deacetylase
MIGLLPAFDPSRPIRLLCIGAHSDDLEVGCGGTLLTWLESPQPVHVTWVVLTGSGDRAAEARRSAKALLRRAAAARVLLGEFKDGFLPEAYGEAKAFLESIKDDAAPDIVLTHRLEDRHQDHRLASELTWNTWRDHLILEYEIMKYEGDLGRPNLYVPLRRETMRRKNAHLLRHFGSQRSKHWFEAENFSALARLRAIECRAPDGFAEAFHARKIVLASEPRPSGRAGRVRRTGPDTRAASS